MTDDRYLIDQMEEPSDQDAEKMCILITPTGKNWTAVRGSWVDDGTHPEGIGNNPAQALGNLMMIEAQIVLEMKEKLQEGDDEN